MQEQGKEATEEKSARDLESGAEAGAVASNQTLVQSRQEGKAVCLHACKWVGKPQFHVGWKAPASWVGKPCEACTP